MLIMNVLHCFIILSIAVEMSHGFFWLFFKDKDHPSEEVLRACDNIFAPELLTISCCKETTIFTQRVKQCLQENVILTSCEQAICIARSIDILDDNDEVCIPKLEGLLRKLDHQHEYKKPNELVRSYCIAYENYKYFPSNDPQCRQWKLLNCLFFSYRLACGIDDFFSNSCKYIKDNVKTCFPYQKKYIELLPTRQSPSCHRCGD